MTSPISVRKCTMPSGTRITSVRFTRARTGGGLLGWVSFRLEPGLLVDGVALRRSQDGALVFSWPARRDRAGQYHHHVRPMDDASRREVEEQLLEQIGPHLLQGGRRDRA